MKSRRGITLPLLLVTVALVAGACSSSDDGATTTTTVATVPTFSLVVAAGHTLAVVDQDVPLNGTVPPPPRTVIPRGTDGGGPHGQICVNADGDEFAVATNAPGAAPTWTVYSWTGTTDAKLDVTERERLVAPARGDDEAYGCAFLGDHRMVTTTASRTDRTATGRVLLWERAPSSSATPTMCLLDPTVTAPRQLSVTDQGVTILAAQFGTTAGLWRYGTLPRDVRSTSTAGHDSDPPCAGVPADGGRSAAPPPRGLVVTEPFGVETFRENVAITTPTFTTAYAYSMLTGEVVGLIDRQPPSPLDGPHRSVAGTPTGIALGRDDTFFTDTDLVGTGPAATPGPNGTVRRTLMTESTPTGAAVLASGLDDPQGLALLRHRAAGSTTES